MIKEKILRESIAYCGLICKLCFLKDTCDGCKTVNNTCERNMSDAGCFQKTCCIAKKYTGCWECADIFNCDKGIYSLGNYSKIKAFSIFIRENGATAFISNVVRNMKNGLSVEKDKDYDNKTIDEVLKMLKDG